MINSFVIEPGIGQEGKFIHERLFSFPPRSGFVQPIAQADAGTFIGAARLSSWQRGLAQLLQRMTGVAAFSPFAIRPGRAEVG
jgi:hypothetical protein